MRNVANTFNFFEINVQGFLFWGLDISPKLSPVNRDILNMARKLKLPFNEVVEIYDDESFKFFKNFIKKLRRDDKNL